MDCKTVKQAVSHRHIYNMASIFHVRARIRRFITGVAKKTNIEIGLRRTDDRPYYYTLETSARYDACYL